ncbi:TEL2-interacting protein 1 [Diutina catenulata]
MDVKATSSEVFALVKPICVELSDRAGDTQPNFQRIGQLLSSLNTTLATHHQQYPVNKPYILAKNLADYIFFPVSGILRHQQLPDDVVQYIIALIQFLYTYAWQVDRTTGAAFTEQMLTLVLNLCKDPAKKTRAYQLTETKFLRTLIYALPMGMFKEAPNKLPMLGMVVTSVVDIFASISGSCTTQEDVGVATNCLDIMSKLVAGTLVDGDALAQILPGVISKLVAFTTLVSSVHYSVLVSVVDVLRDLVSRVFSDVELGIEYTEVDENDLLQRWRDNAMEEEEVEGEITTEKYAENPPSDTVDENDIIKIQIKAGQPVRTASWLRATSKQVKLSLQVLFKNIVNKHQHQMLTKPQIFNSVVQFFNHLLFTSFFALFSETYPLSIDVVALAISKSEKGYLEATEALALLFHEEPDLDVRKRLCRELIKAKLVDLIKVHVLSGLRSSSDEKITLLLTSIRLQLEIMMKLAPTDAEWWKSTFGLLLSVIEEALESRFYDENKPTKTNDSTKFESIELPPHINPDNLKRVEAPKVDSGRKTYNAGLVLLANSLEEGRSSGDLRLMGEFFSKEVEEALETFLLRIGELACKHGLYEDVRESLNQPDSSILASAVRVWVVNQLQQGLGERLDIDDFLDFDDGMDTGENQVTEVSTSEVVAMAQSIVDEVQPRLYLGASRIDEYALCTAYDNIGASALVLSKDDYQAEVLIDYLYPLLEAVTFTGSSMAHHAYNAIDKIAETHYGGSRQSMIVANSDYLVDAITIKLASGDITPSLPGILLVVIKFSGMALLKSNILGDIINQVFVTIDMYHGYPLLMEGFFIVFHELVAQITREYNLDNTEGTVEDASINTSPYTPWGMTNSAQLAAFIEKPPLDPTEYDRDSTYFTRPRDAPFAEMKDSDDEDSDDESDQDMEDAEPPSSEVAVWTSSVPQSTYELVMSVFRYGFKLLSQPGGGLKTSIIRTMRQLYPILDTNYELVRPVLIQNWSVITTLIGGTESLSVVSIERTGDDNVTGAALEFATAIIKADDKPGRRDLSRQFKETWTFLESINQKSSKIINNSKAMVLSTRNPQVKRLFSEFILTGLESYNRQVDDITKYDMVEFSCRQGLPSGMSLCRETQAMVWVFKNGLLA